MCARPDLERDLWRCGMLRVSDCDGARRPRRPALTRRDRRSTGVYERRGPAPGRGEPRVRGRPGGRFSAMRSSPQVIAVSPVRPMGVTQSAEHGVDLGCPAEARLLPTAADTRKGGPRSESGRLPIPLGFVSRQSVSPRARSRPGSGGRLCEKVAAAAAHPHAFGTAVPTPFGMSVPCGRAAGASSLAGRARGKSTGSSAAA